MLAVFLRNVLNICNINRCWRQVIAPLHQLRSAAPSDKPVQFREELEVVNVHRATVGVVGQMSVSRE